jgi:hypothetical protein
MVITSHKRPATYNYRRPLFIAQKQRRLCFVLEKWQLPTPSVKVIKILVFSDYQQAQKRILL